MRRTATVLTAAALTTTTALLFAAAPATAGDAPTAATELSVTIGPSQMDPKLYTALLTCDPVGGDHANAKVACADVDAAKGDIASIRPLIAPCLAYVDPVQISVTGVWQGTPISFTETLKWSNPQCARLAHGYVFAID